ncbi:hypothetical protein ABG768_003965 [Culter alburnus]|uniref:Uncharacterized protein n=1 Tax=Culter alburnus TaxID=194366 RepID=A0AAW2A1Y2_CULAL
MEELKQTMRDVGRHMLHDPLSGAQSPCLRGESGKVLTCRELMFTSVSLKHTLIIRNTWRQRHLHHLIPHMLISTSHHSCTSHLNYCGTVQSKV